MSQPTCQSLFNLHVLLTSALYLKNNKNTLGENPTMHPFIDRLPFELDLKNEMDKLATMRSLPAEMEVLSEGAYLKHLPLLVTGEIRVYKTERSKDREILVYYVREGQTCMMSVVAVYQNLPSKISGKTTQETDVILLPVEHVRDWQFRYRSWNEYIMKGVEERYANLVDAFEAVSFYNIDERLRSFLESYGRSKDTSVIPLSHQELANELGTTRVVVSRILKSLEDQNILLLKRGEVHLVKK